MFAIRGPFAVLGGTLFSVAIFFCLAELVGVKFDAPPLAEATRLAFTPQRVQTPPVNRRQPKPERAPPTLTPNPPAPTIDGADGAIARVAFTRPDVDTASRGRGLGLRGIDGDAIPLVRSTGVYPPRAAAAGIEGFVHVQFSVTAAGTVRDAIVVVSEPGTVFDDAALEAVARWRYNPRVENGVAVERVGLQTVFRFELEN